MSELTAALATIEKFRAITNCPAGVGLQDHLRKLVADNEKAMNSLRQADAAVKLAHEKFLAIAAENVGLRETIDAVRGVADNSSGNGDIAKWSDILPEIDDLETPATNAAIAGIKADGRAEGINFAASRLAAAFNHGFVDKPMAEVGDVVRMILDAKADLAHSPIPPEDGLSGEYAEKSLAEWEAELREGAK